MRLGWSRRAALKSPFFSGQWNPTVLNSAGSKLLAIARAEDEDRKSGIYTGAARLRRAARASLRRAVLISRSVSSLEALTIR